MTQEKHDPWALLREARTFVALSGYGKASLARIDAALAAHEAEERVAAVSEPVWEPVKGSRTREERWDDGNHLLTVRKHRLKTVLPMWEWYAEDRNGMVGTGYRTTLDEAKAAAIAAARGMK